jgi:hypothetical protein
MTILTDSDKVFDNIKHHFKVSKKLELEGTHLTIVKAKYDKATVNDELNGEKLKTFP